MNIRQLLVMVTDKGTFLVKYYGGWPLPKHYKILGENGDYYITGVLDDRKFDSPCKNPNDFYGVDKIFYSREKRTKPNQFADGSFRVLVKGKDTIMHVVNPPPPPK